MNIVNLKKEYKIKNAPSVQALKGVSFEFPQKGMIFILGKSGSGKSTLLKLLAGLEEPSEGEILVGNRKLASFSKDERDVYRSVFCGFIFQEYNVLPELNVKDNISVALELQGEKDTQPQVRNVLEEVELSGFENRNISELSGGQKQRVAIARALIKNPSIIFADEPTGALDSKTGENILLLLKKISKEKLVLVVTHDRNFAEKFGDRILELSDGQIIRDEKRNSAEEEKNLSEQENFAFKIQKTRLSIKTALKIGKSNFKYHPIRLLMTILLSVLAFAFFGISEAFARSTEKDISVDSVYSLRLSESMLYKKDNKNLLCSMTDEDFRAVTKEYDTAVLRLLETEICIEELGEKGLSAYYSVMPYAYAFVEESDLKEYSLSYIGRFAREENEVMITSYTAEQLVAAGISPSAESLLNTYIAIDEEKCLITAIIDTEFNEKEFFSLRERKEPLKSKDKQLFDELSKALNGSRHNIIYRFHGASSESREYSGFLVSLKNFSKQKLSSLYSFSNSSFHYQLNNSIVDDVREAMETVETFNRIILILSGITGIFAVVMMIYFISQSIEDKYRTIAVLKTMGASNKSIVKIFLWESLLLGSIIFLLTILMGVAGCGVLNRLFATTGSEYLVLFRLKITDILILFSLIGGSSLLGGGVPLWKINHSKKLDYFER